MTSMIKLTILWHLRIRQRTMTQDKTDQLQMYTNSLKVSKHALKDSLLPSRHRAQVEKNQTEVLIIIMNYSENSRLSLGGVRALTGRGWNPVTWNGDVGEDPIKAENFELLASQAFTSPEEVVTQPSAPPYILERPGGLLLGEVDGQTEIPLGVKMSPVVRGHVGVDRSGRYSCHNVICMSRVCVLEDTNFRKLSKARSKTHGRFKTKCVS